MCGRSIFAVAKDQHVALEIPPVVLFFLDVANCGCPSLPLLSEYLFACLLESDHNSIHFLHLACIEDLRFSPPNTNLLDLPLAAFDQPRRRDM